MFKLATCWNCLHQAVVAWKWGDGWHVSCFKHIPEGVDYIFLDEIIP